MEVRTSKASSCASSDVRKYPRTGKRGAPQAFPRKLFELMQAEDAGVISWDPEGSSFLIRDMETFTNDVLERYFKHHKFTSFQRQLNLYGFRKVAKGPKTGYYTHPAFHRDHPEWLGRVRRTPQPGKTSRPGQKTEEALSAGFFPTKSQVETATQIAGFAQLAQTLLGQAMGILDPIGLAADQSAQEADQGLRRSKRRQERLRAYSNQILQQRPVKAEKDAEAAPSPPPVTTEQPGAGEKLRASPFAASLVKEEPSPEPSAAPLGLEPAPEDFPEAPRTQRLPSEEAFDSAIDVMFASAEDGLMSPRASLDLALGMPALERRPSTGGLERPVYSRQSSADVLGAVESLWEEGEDMDISSGPQMQGPTLFAQAQEMNFPVMLEHRESLSNLDDEPMDLMDWRDSAVDFGAPASTSVMER